MPDFVNTVDIVDNDILIDSIITKSISGSFNDDKITSIKKNAFYGCTNLESVDFPNVIQIDNSAFESCTNLEYVCFPKATHIGSCAFNYSGLKAITPETFPSVTILPYNYNVGTFYNSALETVDWPSFVAVGDGLFFSSCKSLRSVNLPNYIGRSEFYGKINFNDCTSLTDVNLPLYPNGLGFNNCTSLETITLPSATTSGTFGNCTSLKIIDLPSCTSFGGNSVVQNCSSLKAIILRSTTMCTRSEGYSPFNGSSIEKGTGYIYVPKALIDSYKTEANWSVVASQFRPIEDYTVDGTITGAMREHCESFALNVTTLTFTDANHQTLTAIGVFGILDDPLVWSTSDPTVARVNNGVVVPMGDGTATITVTCGEHSATCMVTVNAGIEYTNILAGVGFNVGYINNNGTIDTSDGDTNTEKFDVSLYAGSSIVVQLIDVKATAQNNRIVYYDNNNALISYTSGVAAGYGAVITSTVPENAVYAAISVYKTKGFSAIEIYCDGIQIGDLEYIS